MAKSSKPAEKVEATRADTKTDPVVASDAGIKSVLAGKKLKREDGAWGGPSPDSARLLNLKAAKALVSRKGGKWQRDGEKSFVDTEKPVGQTLAGRFTDPETGITAWVTPPETDED